MALFSRKAKKPTTPAPPAAAGVSGRTTPPAPHAATHTPPEIAALEPRIKHLGAEMLAFANDHKSGLLSKQLWSDCLFDWSMKDQNF